MPANFCPENDADNGNSDPLDSIFTDLSVDEESEVRTDSASLPPSRFKGRRGKAALVLTIVWSGTITLHLVSWGSIFVLGLTTMLGVHALGIMFAKSRYHSHKMEGDLPFVSVLVAAKN